MWYSIHTATFHRKWQFWRQVGADSTEQYSGSHMLATNHLISPYLPETRDLKCGSTTKPIALIKALIQCPQNREKWPVNFPIKENGTSVLIWCTFKDKVIHRTYNDTIKHNSVLRDLNVWIKFLKNSLNSVKSSCLNFSPLKSGIFKL